VCPLKRRPIRRGARRLSPIYESCRSRADAGARRIGARNRYVRDAWAGGSSIDLLVRGLVMRMAAYGPFATVWAVRPNVPRWGRPEVIG